MVVTLDRADADLFDTPATTEEQVLASFLDTAIDEICRGVVPSLDGVLGQAPQLHNRAERLVLDLGLICNAAAKLWLHSGMSTASASTPTVSTTSAHGCHKEELLYTPLTCAALVLG